MRREQFPPIGAEIADHVEAFCRDRGLDPESAQAQANQIAELMLTIYSGQVVRFPSQPFREREINQRNKRIREEYDGKNASILARKHGLSRRWILYIVNPQDSTTSPKK